jgi:hypothetical protein
MRPHDRTPGTTRSSGSSPGIIDTIGRAFAMLNRRPYLIWMPIVVDLLLWSGVRVSVADSLSPAVTRVNVWWSVSDELMSTVREAISGSDLLGLVTWPLPTLSTALFQRSVPAIVEDQVLIVPDHFALVAIPLATALGLLIGVTYLTMIGRLVSNQPAWGVRFFIDCFQNSVRVAGVVLSALALIGFLLVPFAAVGWGLQAYGITPTGFLAIVAAIYVVWVVLFFVFSPHAIALGTASPFAAMRSSFQIVQRNALSVIGLLIIVVLIRAGTPLALQVFTEHPWSVPFAIVVNAYVCTGLFAATMLYYRDRSADTSKTAVVLSPAH